MNLEHLLIFLLSAFGALNAFLLSIYFTATARNKRFSNYFLALLLLALSVRILKSAFFYISPGLANNYIQIGLLACALIGPSLYLYLRKQFFKSTSAYSWIIHLIPYLGTMTYLGINYPYWSYKSLWTEIIIPILYIQWLIYILSSGVILKDILRKISTKRPHSNDLEIWWVNILFGVFIIWLAYVIASYTSYIVGALSFTFVFYLLLLLWLFKNKDNAIFFEEKTAYENKSIDSNRLVQIINNLHLVEEKELYKNPDIKLGDIARELKVSPHVLSQYLNDNLGKSFSFFINEHRIIEAKKLLGSKKQYTIESIGYESGFNSKSTFFTTFKKITGLTPSLYRKTLED